PLLDSGDEANISFDSQTVDSRARVGTFAANLAYSSAVACFFLGMCTFIWGTVETDDSTLRDMLCGLYCMGIGIVVMLYQIFYGYYRNPTKVPLRAIGYAMLSVFCFFSYPTIIAGLFLIVTACANGLSTYLGET